MNNSYGLLISKKDTLLHRKYFDEMCSMIGVNVQHRAPRPGKTYTNYSEIETNYYEPISVGCIFEEHPTPQTMKKLGWNSELQTSAAIISVPFDLEGLQHGSLFTIPSPFNSDGRLFRVIQINSIMIYPCSLTCLLVPEYETTFTDNSYVHKTDSFNLLNREEEW